MKKKLFLFVTPDGVTYSSPAKTYPDVENFQVLGYGKGYTEREAFDDFVKRNNWVLDTDFNEIICIEIKSRISNGKIFYLQDVISS